MHAPLPAHQTLQTRLGRGRFFHRSPPHATGNINDPKFCKYICQSRPENSRPDQSRPIIDHADHADHADGRPNQQTMYTGSNIPHLINSMHRLYVDFINSSFINQTTITSQEGCCMDESHHSGGWRTYMEDATIVPFNEHDIGAERLYYMLCLVPTSSSHC